MVEGICLISNDDISDTHLHIIHNLPKHFQETLCQGLCKEYGILTAAIDDAGRKTALNINLQGSRHGRWPGVKERNDVARQLQPLFLPVQRVIESDCSVAVAYHLCHFGLKD